jgi:uncharacterized Rossmann fold enzyme
MIYNEWEPIYKEIAKELKYPLKKEEKSAEILNKLLVNNNPKTIDKLGSLIQNNDVIVFGAGPSIEEILKNQKQHFLDKTKIVADGVTTALLKYNLQPDIIVTDLDGNINDQILANERGSLLIVHAHGDNIEKITKYVPKFNGDIVGTIQINPSLYNNIFNFGGFTDGDRAVFIADHFNAKTISLYGFDFTSKIGKYSFMKNKDHAQKLKKLEWCKFLIKSLMKKNQNIFFK